MRQRPRFEYEETYEDGEEAAYIRMDCLEGCSYGDEDMTDDPPCVVLESLYDGSFVRDASALERLADALKEAAVWLRDQQGKEG